MRWLGAGLAFGMTRTAAWRSTRIANLPRQAVDVALMVINLPGQSGIECARQLKALLPKLQIIMLLPE